MRCLQTRPNAPSFKTSGKLRLRSLASPKGSSVTCSHNMKPTNSLHLSPSFAEPGGLRETKKEGWRSWKTSSFPRYHLRVKTWLGLDRACGHTISKQDVLVEYLGRLQLTANEFRNKANASISMGLKSPVRNYRL